MYFLKIYSLFLLFFLFALQLHSDSCESQNKVLSWNVLASHKKLNDFNGWESILTKTFKNIMEYSSLRNTNYKILILDDPCFNAEASVDGEIIIYRGTLEQIDKRIEDNGYLLPNSQDKNKFCSELNQCREKIIAAILAHELAHFFEEDHKTLQEIREKGKDLAITNIIFAMEEKADNYAYSLLYRSLYGEESMLQALAMLKEIEQIQNETPENRKDPYFRNHPSPNRRLLKFTKNLKDKNYFAWALQMEEAFASIKKGSDLEKQLKLLESSLRLFPDNLELLFAKAVCLHKLWMQSSTVSELHLKSIVDMPLFSDNNQFEKIRKGTTVGDKNKYLQAKSAYTSILTKSKLVSFKSNYSVLLAYSEKISDREEAIRLAEEAYEETPSSSNLVYHALNNLAVVYYMDGKQEIAEQLFFYLCLKYGWKELFSISKSKPENGKYSEYATKLQTTHDYPNDNKFVALLNYCLVSNQLEHCKKNPFFKSNSYFSQWIWYINQL